jgi:uncharacterized protein (DUF58 family)
MKVLRSIHITRFFFLIAALGIALIGLSFFTSLTEAIGILVLLVLVFLFSLDLLILFMSKKPVVLERKYTHQFNLGDENNVTLLATNTSNLPIQVAIYEGFPIFMQRRKHVWNVLLPPQKPKTFEYSITPTERGVYMFTPQVILMRSPLFLAQRRIIMNTEDDFHVYPSVLQMKRYELKVFNPQTLSQGIKKVRRIGNTSEFEQIRNYIQGDDLRTMNWKATSRRNELMVNQYQEERSQSIYCLLDKSRPMQLAFNNMTVMDYAINSSLVLSNIILRKGDRAGLITFSNKIGSIMLADRKQGQLRRITEMLHNQQSLFKEASYELLYQSIRQHIKTRSLLFLFTNFESEYAMRRELPLLQKINKKHVLVLIFFQNNELIEISHQQAHSHKDIIESAVAEKLVNIKWNIVRELKQNGIQSILTKPEDLSLNTINKYLELKSKGVI